MLKLKVNNLASAGMVQEFKIQRNPHIQLQEDLRG